MIPLTEDRKMLGYELLASYPGISCFVTTRHGGCSQGNYASLNCTPYTGDEAEAVRRNQEIVCSSLPQRPQELVIPFHHRSWLHRTADAAKCSTAVPEYFGHRLPDSAYR